MKLLGDFLPVILFFITFKYADAHKEWASAFATEHLGFLVSGGQVGQEEGPVMLATVVVILATLAQVLWLKLRGRKVGMMLWVGLAIVTVLGSATIWFHSENFIKWKPSVLYWTLGLSFWLSRLLFRRNLLKLLMGEQIELPDIVWARLNFAWIAFFGFMGLLNRWVAYSFSLATWVDFKLFGGIGLMLAFTIAQGFYLAPYIKEDDDAAAAKSGEETR